MATNPETRALLEKALQHVLAEQARVLKHKHAATMLEQVQQLGKLAADTWELLLQGFHRIKGTQHLTAQASAIERAIDDISVKYWFHLDICVKDIYEHVERSFTMQPVQEELRLGGAILFRNHFHNLRLLLLEQLLSARMLINNNDYGSESERVWQEFFQRELGSEFRVLQGGHMLDYTGKVAEAQIDLVVVRAEAHVIAPGISEGGKVNVLCDQVIAAFMITSNLTTVKLSEDWQKLKKISSLFKFTDEFPNSKEQAWPLCYIVAGQSAPLDTLEKTWVQLATVDPEARFVPQFLMSLDSGFLYSGATSWPRPRYPTNYVKTDEVQSETGIYAGLGLAYILTQIRARAKLMKNQPTRSEQRFMRLLDDATMKSAMPPTWSPRFDHFGSVRKIEGILWWGNHGRWAHNRMFMTCLKKDKEELKTIKESYFYRDDMDVTDVPWNDLYRYMRWFHHGLYWKSGELIVLEEWTQSTDDDSYFKSYAVFNAVTAVEVKLSSELRSAALINVEQVLKTLTGQEAELRLS